MKRCSKCLKFKDFSEFYVRKAGSRKGELYNHCKSCLKIRGRQYYRDNQIRQLALANKRRREYRIVRRELIVKLKNKPCADCGKQYPPYVMDFDHKQSCDKVGNIAELVNRNFLTIDKLIKEIHKCDIVCANCHRIRTFTRKNENFPVK